MRKFFISADIEGVCGISDWVETEVTQGQGAYFRSQMTKETAAVCEAANEAGECEIFIKDAHASGRNIIPSMLPENIKIMRSWTTDPFSMMAGLNKDFDGVALVGYHSAAGRNGNPLAHTMSQNNSYIKINGEIMGEYAINIYTAGYFGVPVLMLTGDKMLCEDVKKILPNVKTVAVSEGIGGASVSIHPDLAVRKIKETFCECLKEDLGNFAVPMPKKFTFEIMFKQHKLAHRASFYPGVKQLDSYRVEFSSEDWLEVLTFQHFVMS